MQNSYKADAVTLTGNTALAGEKTLTGRDGKTDEAFNFKLTPDAETQKAIEKNDVSIAENGDTASVKNLKNGEAKDFGFGNVTFRKEGVYRFDITEKVPGTQQRHRIGSDGQSRIQEQIRIQPGIRNHRRPEHSEGAERPYHEGGRV